MPISSMAKEAGLHEPTIYGGIDSKKYILEANGCCCAFIDYDNDGWMDIFLLCGTRLDGAPAQATNRLYKNNRDGTFTDVTEKSGLRAVGWGNGAEITRTMDSKISSALIWDKTGFIEAMVMGHLPT